MIEAPQVRYTQDNQTPVAEMAVQIEGLRPDDPPGQLKVVGWGSLAQDLQNRVQVGQRLVLEGRLRMNTVTRQDGVKEKRAEFTLSRLHPLAGAGAASFGAAPGAAAGAAAPSPQEFSTNPANGGGLCRDAHLEHVAPGTRFPRGRRRHSLLIGVLAQGIGPAPLPLAPPIQASRPRGPAAAQLPLTRWLACSSTWPNSRSRAAKSRRRSLQWPPSICCSNQSRSAASRSRSWSVLRDAPVGDSPPGGW